MTIRQQGGIFGRSPSFNTVETTVLDADNLRLDGNTLSSTNTDGDIILDPNGSGDLLLPSGNFGINAATPNNKLQINSGYSASAPSAGSGGHGLAVGDAGFGLTAGALLTGDAYLQVTRWDGIVANYNLVLQPNGGNVSVGSGNLAFASGSGIDFSATSGTGTSELFDDYEEGTWTGTYGGNTAEGTYTKIGRAVYVDILLSANSASFSTITGLPYACAGAGYSGGFSIGRVARMDFLDANGVPCRVSVSGTTISFTTNVATGGDAAFTVTSDASGTVRAGLSGVYYV